MLLRVGAMDVPPDLLGVSEFLHDVLRGDGYSPAVACAVLDARRRRVVRIGDVSVCVGPQLYRARKRVDEIAGAARAALLSSLLRSGDSVEQLRREDPGREAILPLLRAASAWRNIEGAELGFPVVDGTSTPLSMIDVMDVPAGAQVVLATDGYVDVHSCLERTEEAHAVRVRSDPLCIGPPPGTKGVLMGCSGFDDRTYVRVQT